MWLFMFFCVFFFLLECWGLWIMSRLDYKVISLLVLIRILNGDSEGILIRKFIFIFGIGI